MPTLSAPDRNVLLSYAGFRSYVENNDNQTKYRNFVVEWRENNSDDPRLVDPDYIAAALSNFLLFYDDRLPELMRNTLQDSVDDDATRFYLYIAQYFVDFTDGLIE